MILRQIVNKTAERIAAAKRENSLEQVKQAALQMPRADPFAFEKALRQKPFAFICEIKKASPSKGVIAPNFPYLKIAKEYESAGAAAISVLTEPDFFLGSLDYLAQIKKAVRTPLLRKDFILDEYQIYESKLSGADAVLLICSILSPRQLARYLKLAGTLGLSALVETHSEAEIAMALSAKARIIGVNNRNLADFSVDLHHSISLRRLVPDPVIFIAESGVKTAADIKRLRENNIHAALIGETLMRADDKKNALSCLKGRPAVPKIKICGLTRPEDITAANETKPDYIGFVFAPSPRQISFETALKLKQRLSLSIQAVGVFADEPQENIIALCRQGIIDAIQLHGTEDNAYIKRLQEKTKRPVIKAIRVQTDEDIAAAQHCAANILLFDAHSPAARGGTGKTFDWKLLGACRRPFWLAGGINTQNLPAALHTSAALLDISSGAETDAKKDPRKIKEIIHQIRR